eukprot:3593182-Pleurochrysis_carterae.AAC.2
MGIIAECPCRMMSPSPDSYATSDFFARTLSSTMHALHRDAHIADCALSHPRPVHATPPPAFEFRRLCVRRPQFGIPKGEILHTTTDHNPDLEAEIKMAETIAQARPVPPRRDRRDAHAFERTKEPPKPLARAPACCCSSPYSSTTRPEYKVELRTSTLRCLFGCALRVLVWMRPASACLDAPTSEQENAQSSTSAVH